MNTEQQSELEEIKKLIERRFDKQDEKISELKIEIVKSESRLNQKINEVESKLGQEITQVNAKVSEQIAGIKVDTTWIKWLFGGLLSFILILLSLIITILFKFVT